ncbi:hypothetical protein [Rhizosaccharibacter radicis]|uniref:Secreted protein n=1 Tax=Rhizosaccharibacter radicis TaxID=2782605 RepID=A0ABT1VWI4_9PROT|nr:hypothetical protein [Acetobacteraceae bacterium KSS12]
MPLLGTALLLSGCGHDDKVASLSVTCNGSLVLAGARSVEVNATSGTTSLSFPDPNNPDHTGSLQVEPGRPCTVALQLDKKPDGSS